jgi:amino acid transporter
LSDSQTLTKKVNESAPRQLNPLLVWAVVFCDIGTSVYYVPGILYGQVGLLAPLFVIVTTLGFILLATKYTEICWRHPQGGGVVSIATDAFSPSVGVLGGMLIIVDYFLTSAISSVSGIHYLGSIFPSVEHSVVLVAVGFLFILAMINVIGIRESAWISTIMAVAAFVVNLAVVVATLIIIGPPEWNAIWTNLTSGSSLTFTGFLVGFGGAWLAFSGLESISQLSPAMNEPVRRTAKRGMIFVIASIVITSPLLTLFSVALLPEHIKATESERFISELGYYVAGFGMKVSTVCTASILLLFAANTAIIGAYHIFLALSRNGYLPNFITSRNRKFGTPHIAIMLATIVPVFVVFMTEGNLQLLGDMYAFGLLGAFVLSSSGVDVIRWREGKRDWVFWVGVFTTFLLVVAWMTNLLTKHLATVFGGLIVSLGMFVALPYKQGWFTELFYKIPYFARIAALRIKQVEHDSEEELELVSLAGAEELRPMYHSNTLIAVLRHNPRLIAEAITREKGLGGNMIYALYVEERPGLFVGNESHRPLSEGMDALRFAVQEAQKHDFTCVPVWTVSYDAAEGISRAAVKLKVDAVMMGVGQRSAIYNLFRGHVLRGVIKRLPEGCRLLLTT